MFGLAAEKWMAPSLAVYAGFVVRITALLHVG